MDGRESKPADNDSRSKDKIPTQVTVQAAPYTLCLVCHGSQEFKEQPKTSNQIQFDCWNAADSARFETDEESQRNPAKYCTPNNGLCRTGFIKGSKEMDFKNAQPIFFQLQSQQDKYIAHFSGHKGRIIFSFEK